MKKYIIPFIILLSFIFSIYLMGCGTEPTGGNGRPFSADIWVSVTGSDEAGNGSYKNPYRTIQKGLNEAGTGETVGVMVGKYDENIIWPSTEAVTLRGVTSSVATIDGTSSGKCIDIGTVFPPVTTLTIRDIHLINGYDDTGSGAGIDIGQNNINVNLSNVSISSCEAAVDGGGLYVEHLNCRVLVTECAFSYNDAGNEGGGIYSASPLIIDRCLIYRNNATVSGGGVLTGGLPINMIVNSIFHKNTPPRSAALRNTVDNFTSMINCTFAGHPENTGYTTPYNPRDDISGVAGFFIVLNSIIWDTTTEINRIFEMDCSDVEGGGAWTGTPLIGGNVDIDPKFKTYPAEPSDLHLTEDTPSEVKGGGLSIPALPTGIPVIDFEGKLRTMPYSMGAYEY